MPAERQPNRMAFFTRSNPPAVPIASRSGCEGVPEPVVSLVMPGGQRVAVARLIGARDELDAAVDTFLAQAQDDGTDLSALFAAKCGEPGGGTEVALAVRSPGRTVVVFASPPPFSGRESAGAGAARSAAISAASSHAALSMGARLAQALLNPEESVLIQGYEGAGFARLADLAYLRRDLRTLLRSAREKPAALPPGVGARIVRYSELEPAAREPLLREALARSYEGTMDCPALCGLRTIDDVVESHKAVGRLDPSLWWLILEGDERAEGTGVGAERAAGCILLSVVPETHTIELVYLGLAPPLRGRGVGDALFVNGLQGLCAGAGIAHADTMACAVDLANAPAMRFYERWGFKRFATRVALVRALQMSAGAASTG